MEDALAMGFFEKLRFGLGRNTVRVLLDLDGSVAAEGSLTDGSYQTFSSSGYANWRVRKTVLDWLARTQDDERVELIWSSTWQQYANSIFEELGKEPLEWIAFDESYQRPEDWYKSDGIKLFLEENSDPIVIVDDDLPPAFLEIENPRVLCIRPNSLEGLTDEDLSRIDQFVEDYRDRKLR